MADYFKMSVLLTIISFVVVVGILSSITSSTTAPKHDYGYSSLSNTTERAINATQNATYSISIGAFASGLAGVTANKELSVTVENTNTTAQTIITYLNGVSLGTFTAAADSTTSHTYTGVSYVESANNNLTVGVA